MRSIAFVLLACSAVLFTALSTAEAQEANPAMPAPTRIYPEPAVYLLLRLPGDQVTVRYTPGSLDRAANLQTRLQLASRAFKRWVGFELEVNLYVLNREEWRQTGYNVPYGVPVRVGRRGLAAPAEGDDETVLLWATMLAGNLPAISGTPIRGTPQQTATMILADLVTQLQMCEILADEIGIAGDQQWVRGLVTHVASVDLVRRLEPVRLADLDIMYDLLTRQQGTRAYRARDYTPDLTFRDWLWFQAQFHQGAQALIAKTGKGAVKKMKQLGKKTDGVLSAEILLDRFDPIEEWYRTSFTTVSLRR